MTASLLHGWFGWPDGAVLTNLIASALWVPLTFVLTLRHFRCQHCWRPARVPVSGTHYHVCKKHAIEHGHVHP